MRDRRSEPADWVIPAMLVGVGISLLLMLGLVLIVTDAGPGEPVGIAEELDVYTRCLNDHGASVPRVEAERDGGFSITVPGSLVDEGFDPSTWWKAHGECSDVAPDLFGGLVGSLTDGLIGGLPGEMSGNALDGLIEDLMKGA
ncbi:MAG TPA: hypothetical protein VFD97_01570 [Acidimicrobiia bacterium]|nr:hypothetical protein [Acidimicrobiia bacterium]